MLSLELDTSTYSGRSGNGDHKRSSSGSLKSGLTQEGVLHHVSRKKQAWDYLSCILDKSEVCSFKTGKAMSEMKEQAISFMFITSLLNPDTQYQLLQCKRVGMREIVHYQESIDKVVAMETAKISASMDTGAGALEVKAKGFDKLALCFHCRTWDHSKTGFTPEIRKMSCTAFHHVCEECCVKWHFTSKCQKNKDKGVKTAALVEKPPTLQTTQTAPVT